VLLATLAIALANWLVVRRSPMGDLRA